jgi:outer membrane protein OmpA-like peptidoglycan-associated protein/uncharacterized protein YidB (DUF937 family)
MSLFDSIINGADEKFGLGTKAGTLVSALLALMTDQNRGGFAGFLDNFSKAGLGDLASSWISSGVNTELSDEQAESALGEETISELAQQSDIEPSTAKSALAYLIPNVVDRLTPDGVVPEETDLLSRIGDFLSGIGGAATSAAGAVGATAGEVVDRVDAAAGSAVGAGKDAINSVGNMAGDAFDGNSDSGVLKWLLPLILLGLLLLLGFWFCSKPPVAPVATNTNNTNVATNTNAGTNNTNTGTNAANKTVPAAATETERKLTEVSLPDGTKLQAYPGGIEDQLVKFIQSDEFKNGTADSLKDKWFNFDDLNFKSGTTELVPESKRQLDNIVAILKAFPAVKIKIGGYTDKIGNDAANKKLSDDRAKAVKAALDKAGVGAQVPEAEGYGEEFAKAPETASDQERASDRKTSVRLLK